MVKVYCDMCGKPVDQNIDGVNLDFFNYGVVKFKTDWKAEKNLCIACAQRVLNWINNECSKINNERADNEREAKT